jgi:hypothetical protein
MSPNLLHLLVAEKLAELRQATSNPTRRECRSQCSTQPERPRAWPAPSGNTSLTVHDAPDRSTRQETFSCSCGYFGTQLEGCGCYEQSGAISTLRELDTRTAEALTVSLYWDTVRDVPVINLDDHRRSTVWTFDVPRDRALDAFDHPFIVKPDAGA